MRDRSTDKSSCPQSIEGIGRRDLLLSGSAALAAASIGSIAPAGIATAMAQSTSRHPHIVYIVADDLGWKDVGFLGLPPEKWSSVRYGFWPFGGQMDVEEASQARGDCREAAAG